MGEAVLRKVGVEVHGIRMPVIRRGDDLVKMAAEHLVEAAASGYAPFTIRNRDVVGVTESLVARAQGNIVTLEEIAADVRDKIPEGDAAVAFRFYRFGCGLSRRRVYSGAADGKRCGASASRKGAGRAWLGVYQPIRMVFPKLCLLYCCRF